MNPPEHDDVSGMSMLELFRVEAETQISVLSAGLLALEQGSPVAGQLEKLMRAAHSVKGAARIVNVNAAVSVAHAMEDCLVAAQAEKITLGHAEVDVLLTGVDLLARICKGTEVEMRAWEFNGNEQVEEMVASLRRLLDKHAAPTEDSETATGFEQLQLIATEFTPEKKSPSEKSPATRSKSVEPRAPNPNSEARERVLRLNAENLNRLLGLAGESLVESRWLRPFSESMQRLKRVQGNVEDTVSLLREALGQELPERATSQLNELTKCVHESRRFLNDRLEELDQFDRRSIHLSNRLYLEVLRARMRPFSDGVERFPRMVRDLARSLGKKVRLEIVGENTQVDRDILDRLEAPLAHLLRNSVDHGCEPPEQRKSSSKPLEATIRLEARHSAGMLLILVSDDGSGVDLDRVRQKVVDRKLTTEALAGRMTEGELLEFLFLPGFTVRDAVTEISGRGVGLDIVQDMVKGLRGSVRVSSEPGKGVRVQMHLPLTLSVLRTLLVEIAGEPFAFPLAQIGHTLNLARENIRTLEGRQHFPFGEHHIGLVTAHQVLECPPTRSSTDDLPVVILGERNLRYGLVVDRFLGERELVVQPLDPRLGKVTNVNAAALMEDGSPALIVDVEDMVRSIEKLVSAGSLTGIQSGETGAVERRTKRILAVDDSLTVRELERKLLTAQGFVTEVAVDGMDGWNAVRNAHFDLVITDVDMPRMDGIELTKLIKQDARLKSLPVMIVSYKDREEDRLRGLEAGADYYLTKGSFHDETLLRAVEDLIGAPTG